MPGSRRPGPVAPPAGSFAALLAEVRGRKDVPPAVRQWFEQLNAGDAGPAAPKPRRRKAGRTAHRGTPA